MKYTDVLIVGSGVAALQLAKKLRSDMNVIILTKSSVINGNSYMAQGGVAVALGRNDDSYKHYLDTMEAGRFHNNKEIVMEMTTEAPALIKELFENGCGFDTNSSGELLLGMEGAHSEKRIVHGGGDATGQKIMNHLVTQLGEHITVINDVTVYELIMEQGNCIGAKGKYQDDKTEYFFADHIVLATGGCGQIFSFTSNAETVSGDGIALAYRAGAEIADMEFVQFHPTLLYIDGKARGLVSEAVRGDGAKLVTSEGVPIMEGIHPMKDLGPRHIVSQTIYDYLKRGEQVFLDITNIKNFKARFPTITTLCEKHKVNLTKGLIPVVPGCHFLMGGVKTDKHARTNIPGLYAIGEVACTGIHGANRLASNSLLEGLFFGKKLSDWLNSSQKQVRKHMTPYQGEAADTKELTLPTISEIKENMMKHTGIVRTKQGLEEQRNWLESYEVEAWLDKDMESLSVSDISRVFMLITAWLITDSAIKRTESRGGHYREDHPSEKDEIWAGKQIIQQRKLLRGGNHEQIETALAT